MVSKKDMEIVLIFFVGSFVIVSILASYFFGEYSFDYTTGGAVLPSGEGPYRRCTDSDYGINFDTAGVCTDFDTGMQYKDYCSGNALIEYYCSSDGCKKVSYSCPGNCEDGTCS